MTVQGRTRGERSQVTAAVVLVLLLAHGCATPRRLYEGPPRSAAEVAVLRHHPENWRTRFRVEAIDGGEAPGKSWELLPGIHSIEMTIHGKKTVGSVYYTLVVGCAGSFQVAAGGEYFLDGRFDWDQERSQALFDASVTDSATGELAGRIDCIGE